MSIYLECGGCWEQITELGREQDKCPGCGLVAWQPIDSDHPKPQAKACRAIVFAGVESQPEERRPWLEEEALDRVEFPMDAVYQGEAIDLLRLMPSDSVDALITDPPYSSGGLMRSDRNQSTATKYERDDVAAPRPSFTGDNRDGRSWSYWSALWLSECLRIVKEGGYAATFCDWRQLPTATDAFQAGGFVWRGVVAWDKGESARAPHTGYFRHQCEYLVWGSKGPLAAASHGGPWAGCQRFPVKQDDKHHQTGKPTELMRQLVRIVPPGGVVLDPFAGSGTTIVGAVLEGRHGIGFEFEAHNVKTSNERIQGARDAIDGKAAIDGQRPLFQSTGAAGEPGKSGAAAATAAAPAAPGAAS